MWMYYAWCSHMNESQDNIDERKDLGLYYHICCSYAFEPGRRRRRRLFFYLPSLSVVLTNGLIIMILCKYELYTKRSNFFFDFRRFRLPLHFFFAFQIIFDFFNGLPYFYLAEIQFTQSFC